MTANARSPLPPGNVDPQACTHRTRLQVLRRVPVFRDLDPDRLQRVNEYLQARDYRAGEMIDRP